jgi:tetratricopeptide (TPR) repeat protein
MNLQQAYPNPVRLAQAYGFLAEVELNASRWQPAKQNAQKALAVLAKAGESQQQHQGLYLLLLAESERHLGQQHTAIEHLKRARDMGAIDNPQLYVQILQALRSLYFEQQQYLEAFRTKLKRLSIEQQYGFRAFIGAGWLQPRRQAKLALTGGESPETVALEITASDRQQDVERLIERIGRNDCKLIVIHGHSGVGKSSLVNAGLVPALKQKAIGTQDVLPVAMRVYTNWVAELGRLLATETANSASLEDTAAILEQLRQNEQHNLRTVLIFDQFEEFFFYVSNPVERQQFFEFLGKALHILSVKVILSLDVYCGKITCTTC